MLNVNNGSIAYVLFESILLDSRSVVVDLI